MSMKKYIAILVAFLADATQVGTTIITFGADLLVIPQQVLFSVFISIVLAILMKPNVRLLPSGIIEVIPFMSPIPSFTVGAVWVALKTKD